MKLACLTPIKAFCLICACALLFSRCGGNSSQNAEENTNSAAFEEAEQKISTDLTTVIKDLPSPTEVPYMMQASGAAFSDQLINTLDKIGHYESNIDEAGLNLGIYATDIGYLLSYDKVAESKKYLDACHKLAETLGVSSVFDIKTLESFQDNLHHPDSLNNVLTKAILEAEEKLQHADRMSAAALVMTGSFIESLYLVVRVIETYPKGSMNDADRNAILEPLVKLVLEQKKPLIDIVTMLKDLPQDPIINKMITELDILKLLYDSDLSDIEKQIQESNGEFHLKEDMLMDVTGEVKRIRLEIINFE